ncbi:hydrolase [Ensifer sp. IC4062]|nr:isochorismate family cysteine hydrolase YcaC [Ensifer sp. IC4062]MCA1443245.1 hydrolase [Ensifer sp. IC4062]
MSATPGFIRKEDAVVLMLDHQTGLFSLVRDFQPDEFRNNVLALGATAKYFGLPTILATSMDQGPNGVLLPQLREILPDAPVIKRPGEINAWDNPEFLSTLKATGKKQIIVAGIVTDVCVAMPTLSALAEGYEVFVVVDASGTFSNVARDAAHTRMANAGAQLINWFAVACELQRDWRNGVEGLAALFEKHIPDYGNLISGLKR